VTTDEERVPRGGLNRDQAVQVNWLNIDESFVGKREQFAFSALMGA